MSLESYRQSRAAQTPGAVPPVPPRPSHTYTSDYEKGYEDARRSFAYGQYAQPQQFIEIRQKSNGMGIAGFVLVIISILMSILCLIPYLFVVCLPASAFLCLLAFIFSFIGLFKEPRGFAIAGFILSLIGIVGMAVASSAIISFFNSLNEF